MLGILWILVLLAVVGAREQDPWEFDVKYYLDALNRDINLALRKSSPTESLADSTYKASSPKGSTDGCTSTASSTAYPASQPTVGHGCDSSKISTESSTQGYPLHVGSVKGVPGVNFPDYTDIPLTSFSCSGKVYIPGFYADMETGCQVFHVCWPHRRESFLCPVGTIFNQALLACDYWYSSNCSLTPHYYNINEYAARPDKLGSKKDRDASSMIDVLLGSGLKEHSIEQSKDSTKVSSLNPDSALSFISQFLPVKAKVTVHPETADTPSKIVATASVGKAKQSHRYDSKYVHRKQSRGTTEKPHPTSDAMATPEYVHSTQSSDISVQKYAEVEKAVKSILDDVFETVQNILREAQGILATERSQVQKHTKHVPITKLDPRFVTKPADLLREAQGQKHTKHVPITKLDPRFVTKPADLPQERNGKASTSGLTAEDGSIPSSDGHPATYVPEKPLQTKNYRHAELGVSSMTKKALTNNYLRLLKIRKA